MKNTAITMQIINSKKFNRINIKFSDKPSEEIRNELKNAGWIYSSKNNVWYPVNSTDNNSIEFAKELETKYFSDQRMQEDVIINSNDKKKLLELIENDSDLNEIITKMNDLYGPNKIKAIFESTLKEIEAESENPKNNKITEQSENKQNSISEEEDLPYVTPFEVIERNEMLYAGSDRPSGYTYQIRTDDGLKEEIAPKLRDLKENEHLIIEYRKWENGEENDYDFSAYIMQTNEDGTYSSLEELNTRYNRIRIDHLEESETVNAFKAEIRGFVAGYEEMSQYYERFVKETEGRDKDIQLQRAIALSLDKNVSPLVEVKLNRENWNKLFPTGSVETPVGTVKLGENQFDKLQKSDRNNLLGAMYETLSNPAIVLEKETLDEKSGEFRPVNVYGKSFVHEDTNHKRAVESVIIFKDGENISIGTHNKNIKDFVKQIKTADQIIFADSEISRVASLILQNGGSQVRLHDAIATEPLNSNYSKSKLLSIKDLEFSNADETQQIHAVNEIADDSSSLEKSALNKAADLLKEMNFSSENYKDLLSVINKISEMNGIEKLVSFDKKIGEVHDKIDEKTDKFLDTKAGKITEGIVESAAGLPKGSIDAAHDAYNSIKEVKSELATQIQEKEGESAAENLPQEKTPENTVQAEPFDPKAKIIFGKTVLPAFAVLADGKLRSVENAVVMSFDKNEKSYLIESNGEKITLPKETFDTLLKDKIERERVESSLAEGKTIVFQDESRGVKGTVIPEFAMYTAKGLETFKDFVPTGFNKAENSYTLSNGERKITVTADRFKEITAPERFENKFDEESPAWKKLCESQYNDFFQQRENTAYNFRHNLAVYCRKEANSPCDAMHLAKKIVQLMPKEEQKKTEKLLKKMAHENESPSELIARLYHESIKEMPLNEDYIKTYAPKNLIAKPFYDTVSATGQKVENDPSLIKGSSDRNLKIGDTLKNVDIQTEKLFGSGKDALHFDSLKVVSASKEGNSITLMDSNKSFFKLPRDTVLSYYKEQQMKEMKQEMRHSRSNTMTLGYA